MNTGLLSRERPPIRMRAMGSWLRRIHAPDYLAIKAEDFRVFTRVALLITAAFVLSTVIWDFAIDPVGAWNTIGLRLAECVALLCWAAVGWRHAHARVAQAATIAVPLFVSATFIEILTRLEQGNAYGVGGFLYFFIFVPFLVVCQPLVLGVIVLALITVFPVGLAPLGLADELVWPVYAAYVGLGFPAVLGLLLICEYLYWRVYRYREQVEMLAVTDALTGIANRRYFYLEGTRMLEAHRRARRRACLLFIDIDRFKHINDTHGHGVGDLAIRHVVTTVAPLLRGNDLFARYGGEEFVVLLPETSRNAAMAIAERMRAALHARPFEAAAVPDASLTLTISIGVAGYRPSPDAPVDIDVLVNDADAALYEAKHRGRNRVVGHDHAADRADDWPERAQPA